MYTVSLTPLAWSAFMFYFPLILAAVTFLRCVLANWYSPLLYAYAGADGWLGNASRLHAAAVRSSGGKDEHKRHSRFVAYILHTRQAFCLPWHTSVRYSGATHHSVFGAYHWFGRTAGGDLPRGTCGLRHLQMCQVPDTAVLLSGC